MPRRASHGSVEQQRGCRGCSRRNRAAPPYQCGRPPSALLSSAHLAGGIPAVVQVPGRCVATAAILHAVTRALLPAKTRSGSPALPARSPPYFARNSRPSRPAASQETANAADRRVALAAQGREVGVTPEMFVAPAVQVSRDRSLASRCDRPGTAGSRPKQARRASCCFARRPGAPSPRHARKRARNGDRASASRRSDHRDPVCSDDGLLGAGGTWAPNACTAQSAGRLGDTGRLVGRGPCKPLRSVVSANGSSLCERAAKADRKGVRLVERC